MKTTFNKKLYSKAALTEAAAAYKELCKVKIGASGENFVVEFNGYDDGLKDSLADEFGNFALHCTIASKK